jgi:myo-inositol 2-dehydrogenase / D-chiro-inositol 1-dehydrogenase
MSTPREPIARATRRDFIKAGSVVFGGTALAGAMVTPVHAAQEETLKVALIGCGSRGTGAVAQALSTPGPVKLWAMADAFEDRIQSSLEELKRGGEARYDREASAGFATKIDVTPERQFVGLDAYRQAIDSGVDVVLLVEPPGFRPRHFEYAVQAGKHVFMEKPVATDPAGVRRVLAAAKQAEQQNLKVGVGLQRHHQQSYLDCVRRVHDGEIGDMVALRCYWNSGPPGKTPVPREGLTELEYQVRNWYFFDWLSGDHICEQHVHNIDVCNWIKQGHPVEAEGLGGREVRTSNAYGNIFDHHAVEFTYADGTKMFSQCRQIPGCATRVAEFAHGTSGVAEASGMGATIKTGGKISWRSDRRGPRQNPYQVENDALFAAIRNNTPHNEAEYGALSTMTAILGRLATYSGKIVKWDEAMNSDRQLTIDPESWDAKPPVVPSSDGSYPIPVPGVTKVT